MKVFFLSYWFPYPPDNGSRIRVFNFIKALSTQHEVYLMPFLQFDSNPRNAAFLSKYCTIVSMHPLPQPRKSLLSALGFFSKRPRTVIASFDRSIFESVQNAIGTVQPDVVVVSMVDVAEYITMGANQIPSVLIDHNCEFGVIQRTAKLSGSLFSRLRYEMTWRKYAAWEASILRKFNKVVMPTDEDKKKMQDFAPDVRNIEVIPNAADTEYYDPAQWSANPNQLVYNGALTYRPNYDSVLFYKDHIYPELRKIYPDIQLLVTGRYDQLDVRALVDCPGIKLTGYVEDIRDVLYRSIACIIPLRQGGGMRLKIPEALAAGVPVISTQMGAEGLQCEHETHLLIADTPQEFVRAIQRVIEEPDLVETLRVNGRRLVEEQYSWARNAGQFVDLVKSLGPGRK
jgi:glycosyltransferase involved in cell wall biosynthesis